MGGLSGLSPGVLRMLIAEARARDLLGGDRGAIVSRLETLAEGVLPEGAGVFSAAFSGARVPVSRPAPGRRGGEGALRAIGDAFLRARLPGREELRRAGSFYTPDAVIDRIFSLVRKELFPGGKPFRGEDRTLCDPALGCGFFFLRLVARAREAKTPIARVRRWASASLFGADRDAEAVFLAKALLWLALSDGKTEFVPPAAHFAAGDSLLGPAFGRRGGEGLDWGRAFPDIAAAGGFDVIVGNPPYEVLTNFGRHPEQKALADALRRCGAYRDALSGQINLYRCFIERGLDLLKPGGALSFVAPLSLARDGTAAALRLRLLEEERTERWFLYGEKERLFHGVTQAACVFKALRGGGAAKAVALAAGGRGNGIPLAELRRHSPDCALPGLNAKGLRLWRWFHRHCPGRLGDVAGARVGEVDQTVYRACMVGGDTGVILARGAHLSPFLLDTEAREEAERFLDLPRFLAMKGPGAAACLERAGEWRVAQLGIRNMQSRPRLIAALAPPGVHLGNSLNVYRVLPGVDRRFVAGVLNSAWLDWLFRARSGNNNINLREMLALPFPARADVARAAEVAERFRACERAAGNGEGLREAREALDGAVARCYGVPAWARADDLEAMLL